MAQLAAEIRRTIAKEPKKINLKQFMLDFQPKEEKKFLTKEEKLKKMEASKNAWMGILSLSKKKLDKKKDK